MGLSSGVFLILLALGMGIFMAHKHRNKKTEERVNADLNPVYGLYQLGEDYERQYSTNEAVDYNSHYGH